MLYGALPGTETGKLSVPHQNPGGPSPAGAALAATAGMSRIRARQAVSPPRVSHDRFMSPLRDRFVISRPLYDGPTRLLVGRTGPEFMLHRGTADGHRHMTWGRSCPARDRQAEA